MVMWSVEQKIIALSVTEVELIAATMTVQEILRIMRLLELIELEVKNSVLLESDNKEALDICNSYTIGGRRNYIDTRYYFLREMKEENIAEFSWIQGKRNSTDLLTKNLKCINVETFVDYKTGALNNSNDCIKKL